MDHCRLTEPPWTRDLPRLERDGFQRLPSPASSFDSRTYPDPVRSLALGVRRRCSLCGCSIPDLAWHVLCETPAEHHWELHPGGVYTSPGEGPFHQSCAIFTAASCPFLRHKTSRRKNTIPLGSVRGDAAIVAFRRYGLAFFSKPWPDDWQRRPGFSPLWAYVEPVDTTRYATPKDLASHYYRALSDDAKIIDESTRVYFSHADNARLSECARRDNLVVAAMKVNSFTWVGGHGYRLALL